jgi:Leucine-rich repeat (LRR) protein
LNDLTIASSFHPSREQLGKIAQMRNLTRLALGGSDKREALTFLSNLVNLEEVLLRLTEMNDRDLAVLLSLPKLKTLDLSSNSITDAGLKTLAGIRTLKTLVIPSNPVTDAGIAELRKVRPDLDIRH